MRRKVKDRGGWLWTVYEGEGPWRRVEDRIGALRTVEEG